MSGYGFDQIVLRAEIVAAGCKPSAVVVSFIADDVRRTEMRRRWGAEKPYFDIGRRRAGPAQRAGAAAARTRATRCRSGSALFGYSLAGRHRPAPPGLAVRLVDRPCRASMPPGSGERLACPLMRRLARASRVPTSGGRPVRPLRLGRMPTSPPSVRRLTRPASLQCAERSRLRHARHVRGDRPGRARAWPGVIYGDAHPSPAGT